MIRPYRSDGKAGAATGLPGKPPRTIPALWGHSGATVVGSRHPDGLQAHCVRHLPVEQRFICRIRLPGLMTPCDGQPTVGEARRRTCAKGDPGEVFQGQGDVRVSVVCTSWLASRTCC